jgi:hypothetical protein
MAETRISICNNRKALSLTTDGSGDASEYTGPLNGRLLGLHYVEDDTDAYAGTAELTVTKESTGEVILDGVVLSASISLYPVHGVHDQDGALIGDVYDFYRLTDDRLLIVIASGGDTKTGQFMPEIG